MYHAECTTISYGNLQIETLTLIKTFWLQALTGIVQRGADDVKVRFRPRFDAQQKNKVKRKLLYTVVHKNVALYFCLYLR